MDTITVNLHYLSAIIMQNPYIQLIPITLTMPELRYMWQSRVEIENYSIVYFDHVTELKAL